MVQEWEPSPTVILIGNRCPSLTVSHASQNLSQTFATCGGHALSNPFFHAVKTMLFTQTLCFSQPFSTHLWETWETQDALPPLPPLYPKLQIPTAAIWKTAHLSNPSPDNHIGSFPTFPRRTVSTTIFSFINPSVFLYPSRLLSPPQPISPFHSPHHRAQHQNRLNAVINPHFPEKRPGFPRTLKRKGEYNQEVEIAADFAGEQSVLRCDQSRPPHLDRSVTYADR